MQQILPCLASMTIFPGLCSARPSAARFGCGAWLLEGAGRRLEAALPLSQRLAELLESLPARPLPPAVLMPLRSLCHSRRFLGRRFLGQPPQEGQQAFQGQQPLGLDRLLQPARSAFFKVFLTPIHHTMNGSTAAE